MRVQSISSNTMGFKANVHSLVKMPCGEPACSIGAKRIGGKVFVQAIKERFLDPKNVKAVSLIGNSDNTLDVVILDGTTSLARNLDLKADPEELGKSYRDVINDTDTVHLPLTVEIEDICPVIKRPNIIEFASVLFK